MISFSEAITEKLKWFTSTRPNPFARKRTSPNIHMPEFIHPNTFARIHLPENHLPEYILEYLPEKSILHIFLREYIHIQKNKHIFLREYVHINNVICICIITVQRQNFRATIIPIIQNYKFSYVYYIYFEKWI